MRLPGLVLLVLMILPCSASSAAAQSDPLPALHDHHVRVFTVADGLPSSDVIDIAQGSDVYLYIAGGRGLLRFDGYGFESVPLEGFTSESGRSRSDPRGGSGS